jgi:hypothetical protein
MYYMGTGYLNLQKHLTSEHATTYDQAIVENNWNKPFSCEVLSSKSNAVEACKHSLLPFTQATFTNYIVHFVVADDQVSNTFSVTNLHPHLY